MRLIFSIVLATLPLYLVSTVEWSFNLPYYLLLGGIDADIDQPFRKFVTEYGYPLEVHTDVQTEDGYLLTLFRIPYGIKANNSDVKDKPVVLLVHGLLCSSEDFVVLGPDKSLGFILADKGYDVWFGNFRGTMHSRKHIKFNPTWDGRFWNFSYHELGYYDLAAKVNYILSVTRQEQLYYFGHSQGSTTFFVLNSMRPEYNQRFKFMVALAPGVLLPHSKSLLLRALSLSDTLDNLILKIGVNEVPHLSLYSFLGRTVCRIKGVLQILCKDLHFFNLGGASDQFNPALTSNVMQYQYAGAAVRQGIHYAQNIRTGHFSQYSHGKAENQKIYGSEQPPDYNLTRVVVPIAYFYAKHDTIVPEVDQIRSIKLFPNIVESYEAPYDKLTHMEMMVGDNIAHLVYERAINLLEKF